jgi:hypothetical protein
MLSVGGSFLTFRSFAGASGQRSQNHGKRYDRGFCQRNPRWVVASNDAFLQSRETAYPGDSESTQRAAKPAEASEQASAAQNKTESNNQKQKKATETEAAGSETTDRSLGDVAREAVKLSADVAAEMARRLGISGKQGQPKWAGS